MTVRRRGERDVLHLELDAGRGNILDVATLDALRAAWPGPDARLRAVVLRAAGPHFGYGSSIQDHRAETIEGSLTVFTSLLQAMAATPAPTVAVVQGRCLGGGLELALGCDLILAHDDAEFGLPEIGLGVFPPVAAALLPPRVGSGRAAELALTARRIAAAEALDWGLVQRLAPAGGAASALDAWTSGFRATSRVALRQAALATRGPLRRALEHDLPVQVQRYLDRLGVDPDGYEGVEAFLAKRPPRWSDGP